MHRVISRRDRLSHVALEAAAAACAPAAERTRFRGSWGKRAGSCAAASTNRAQAQSQTPTRLPHQGEPEMGMMCPG